MNCLTSERVTCLLIFIVSHPLYILCADFPTNPHPTEPGRSCYLCPPGYRIDGIYDKARSCESTADGSPTFPDCVECSDGYYMESWTMNHICKEQKLCDEEGQFLLYSGDKTQPNVCGCKDSWYHIDNRCKKSEGNNCPASVVTPAARKTATKTTTTTEKTSTTTEKEQEPVGPNISVSQNVSQCNCIPSIVAIIGTAASIILVIVVIGRLYCKKEGNFSPPHNLKVKKTRHNEEGHPDELSTPLVEEKTQKSSATSKCRGKDKSSKPKVEEKTQKSSVTSKNNITTPLIGNNGREFKPTSKKEPITSDMEKKRSESSASLKKEPITSDMEKKRSESSASLKNQTPKYVNMDEDDEHEDSTLKKDKPHKESTPSLDETPQYVNMDADAAENKATPDPPRGNREAAYHTDNPTYLNLHSERQKLDKVLKVVERNLLRNQEQQLFRQTLLLTAIEIDRLPENVGCAVRTMYALMRWRQKNPSITVANFIELLRENEFFEIAQLCEESLQSNAATRSSVTI